MNVSYNLYHECFNLINAKLFGQGFFLCLGFSEVINYSVVHVDCTRREDNGGNQEMG